MSQRIKNFFEKYPGCNTAVEVCRLLQKTLCGWQGREPAVPATMEEALFVTEACHAVGRAMHLQLLRRTSIVSDASMQLAGSRASGSRGYGGGLVCFRSLPCRWQGAEPAAPAAMERAEPAAPAAMGQAASPAAMEEGFIGFIGLLYAVGRVERKHHQQLCRSALSLSARAWAFVGAAFA